jgi:hypothetical protein
MNNFFIADFKDMKNGIVGKIVVGVPAGTSTTANNEKTMYNKKRAPFPALFFV